MILKKKRKQYLPKQNCYQLLLRVLFRIINFGQIMEENLKKIFLCKFKYSYLFFKKVSIFNYYLNKIDRI